MRRPGRIWEWAQRGAVGRSWQPRPSARQRREAERGSIMTSTTCRRCGGRGWLLSTGTACPECAPVCAAPLPHTPRVKWAALHPGPTIRASWRMNLWRSPPAATPGPSEPPRIDADRNSATSRRPLPRPRAALLTHTSTRPGPEGNTRWSPVPRDSCTMRGQIGKGRESRRPAWVRIWVQKAYTLYTIRMGRFTPSASHTARRRKRRRGGEICGCPGS